MFQHITVIYQLNRSAHVSTHNSDIPIEKLNLPKKMGLQWFSEDNAEVLHKVGSEGTRAGSSVSVNVSEEQPQNRQTGLTRRYRRQAGGFFPYVSNIPIDLSTLQIFCDIKPENYKHNCFIYACMRTINITVSFMLVSNLEFSQQKKLIICVS